MGDGTISAAYLALARLEAAGVVAVFRPDGRMVWRAPAPPPPELVADARLHRDAIVDLLRLRLAEPHWLPERESLP